MSTRKMKDDPKMAEFARERARASRERRQGHAKRRAAINQIRSRAEAEYIRHMHAESTGAPVAAHIDGDTAITEAGLIVPASALGAR